MHDVAIIGGGIVGLATGRELLARRPDLRLLVLEKEPELATHQSSRNSGVIHSGIYYRPGSLRAQLCRKGAAALRGYCDARNIAWRATGKLIVAVEDRELEELVALHERGIANGIEGLEMLDAAAVARREPLCAARAALFVPETAIVDYRDVTRALAADVTAAGGEIVRSAAVLDARHGTSGIALETADAEYSAAFVVACAGLGADGIARALGGAPFPRVEPVRGEYLRLHASADAPKTCIYPVPNPKIPFLGAHVTPKIDASVWLGPGHPGENDVLNTVRRYLPSITDGDVSPADFGVRAQGIDEHGAFVDDFIFETAERVVHVRNAPSPAATAALAIAEHVADMVRL